MSNPRGRIMLPLFIDRFLFLFVLLPVVSLLLVSPAQSQAVVGAKLPADVPIRWAAQALRLASYSEGELAEQVLRNDFEAQTQNTSKDQRAVPDAAAEQNPRVFIAHQKHQPIFDIEAPPTPRIRLHPSMSLGFSAVFEYIVEKNFDLNSSDADDFMSYEFIFPISFSYIPAKDFALFLSLDTGHIFFEDDKRGHDEETILELVHAFLSFRDYVDGLDIKIGRQRIKDEREWLY